MSNSRRTRWESPPPLDYYDRIKTIAQQLCEQFDNDINSSLDNCERALNSDLAELKSARKTIRNLIKDGQREREMSQHLKERELKRLGEIRNQVEETLVQTVRKLQERNKKGFNKEEDQEPLPDPTLPVRECVVCFDDYNEALTFCCRSNDAASERHYICRDCCRGYATAKVGDGALAENGIGFPCASGNCDGVLLWGPISKLVDPTVARNVEARLAGLALDGMDDIEYCKSCHYGVQIVRKEQKYFACQNAFCLVKFCRTCQVDYDRHLDRTCDAVDPTRKDKRRALEDFLSAAKYRVCHRCKTHFTKDNDNSCNKMTCTCGATQCYICKATDVTYDHFHAAGAVCPLFNDSAEADKVNLEHAIQEAEKKEEWRKFLPELLAKKENAR